MANTTLSNLVNPQVMGDMIEAKISALLKITPYAKVDTTLQGVPGDTKTVPSWNYIGDAADVAEGAEVDLTAMTAGTTTFTIKKAMKAVGITQEAVNSGLGNPIGQAETQLAKSIAGKVDQDVFDAAIACTNEYDGTANDIGYAGIVEANGKFEDEEDGINRVMFIHPKQETTLLKDSDFISADKFEAGVAVNGAIGKIAGCWIKKSAKVPHLDVTAGSRTLTIADASGKTIAQNDVFKTVINGETFEYKAGSSPTEVTVGTALAALINASETVGVTATDASPATGVLTLTEKEGFYGVSLASAPVNTAPTNGTMTNGGTYSGAAGYKCPIIKMQPDSPETEFTEDELPALTIFLKKDTQTDAEWKPRTQCHEITTAKYYGVALTNAAKVIIAKFKA